MNKIVTILAIIFVSRCYCQHDEFWFPNKIPIDPLDYVIRSIGVKQIEIYEFSYYNPNESLNKEYKLDSSIVIDFVIKYDSLKRLSWIKYNFQRHLNPVIFTDNKTISITSNTDNIFLHPFMNSSDTILFNSWISEYNYENNELKYVEIKRPQRYMEDGVVINEKIEKNIRIENKVENNFVKQKVIYHDEKLVTTINYEYTKIEANEVKYQLLTKIKTKNESNQAITEQIIKYSL